MPSKSKLIHLLCALIMLIGFVSPTSAIEVIEESMPYKLTVDENYKLTRSTGSTYGLTWVITNAGNQLLGRNASSETEYTYFSNRQGKEYVCWLEAWSKDRYIRVSNYIGYRVGDDYDGPIITSKPSMVIVANEPFEGYQIGATGLPISFTASGLPPGLEISKTGFIYGTPTTIGNYAVTLEASNSRDTGTGKLDIYVVSGENGGGYYDEYTLRIDDSYRITRTTGDRTSLVMVVERNGVQQLGRNALGETHYTYYRNYESGIFTVYLESYISGSYRRVSNIISYDPPLSISNISIYSPSTATGTVGELFYPYTITALGNPTSFSATGLPSGLFITPAGLITGIPKQAGTFTVSVSAASLLGIASKTVTITIEPRPTSPVPLEETFTLSLSGDYIVTRTSGYGTQLQWVVMKEGRRVLARDANDELKYRYYGNYYGGSHSVHLEDWIDGRYQRVSNIVGYTVGNNLPKPVITSPRSWVIAVDQAVTPYQVSATNNPTGFTAIALPDGLSISATTGEITGTPIVSGNFITTIAANNTYGTDAAYLEITVTDKINTSEYDSLYSLSLNQELVVTRSTGNHHNLSWVILKDGQVVLDRLSHTETSYQYYRNFVPGDYVIYLSAYIDGQTRRVSNAVGYKTERQATETVYSILPIIYSQGSYAAVRYQAFSEQVLSSGSNLTFSAQGLPSGLSMNSSGLIQGTPLQLGEFEATITVNSTDGTNSKNITFAIQEPDTSFPYRIDLKHNFRVIRTKGSTEEGLRWVVKRDGIIIDKASAEARSSYIYPKNFTSGRYDIYLEGWRNDAYGIVSNTVSYDSSADKDINGNGQKILVEHALGEATGGAQSYIIPEFKVSIDDEGNRTVTYEYSASKTLAEEGMQLVVEYSINGSQWYEATTQTSLIGEDDQIEHRLVELPEGNGKMMMYRLAVKLTNE